MDILSFCPQNSLVGACYLHPPALVSYFYLMTYYVMARALELGEA